MKWNDSTYLIPEDKDEVVVRYRKKYHVAVFRADKSAFLTSDKKELKAEKQVFWMPLTPPMEELRAGSA